VYKFITREQKDEILNVMNWDWSLFSVCPVTWCNRLF